MFKKSLLVLALAGTATAATAATTVDTAPTTPVSISSQGLPATKAVTLFTAASDAALNGLAGTTAAPYVSVAVKASDASALKNDSRLVIELTGAFFADPATAVATATALGGADALATDDYDIVVADSTSTKLVFELTDADGSIEAGVADDEIIRVGNFDLIVTGTTVSAKAYFETASKVKIPSTEGKNVVIATVADQWKAGVVTNVNDLDPTSGKLDEKIDVGNDRETFEGEETTDKLTFDVETFGAGADAQEAKVTVDGDFTGVKSVTAITTADVGGAQTAVTYEINEAKTEATYTYTTTTDTDVDEATDGTTVLTFSLETAEDKVEPLSARSFDVSFELEYEDAENNDHDINLLDAADAGKWALNGTSNTVNYFPYGPNTQPIMQVTSTFKEDVTYDVSYLNAATGKMVTLDDVGTINSNDVTKIGVEVGEAIKEDSGTESGKTKVVISVNAPSTTMSFFNAFKDLSDKDRLGL